MPSSLDELPEQKMGRFGGGRHRADWVTHALIFTSATAGMRCSYARIMARESERRVCHSCLHPPIIGTKPSIIFLRTYRIYRYRNYAF